MKESGRKISSEEIAELYRFTRKHYVEYYDVQTELVDHLATAMEERWQKAPEMVFEENLNLEFKKFGIFGFSEIVEKRQAALQKKYFRLIFEEMKSLLLKPKVIFIVSAIFLLSKLVLNLEQGIPVFSGFIFFYVLILLFFSIKWNIKLKKKKKNGQKTFLLEQIILNTGAWVQFFIWPFYILNIVISENHSLSPSVQWIFALIVSFQLLAGFIGFYKLPGKRDEILQKAHPELKFLE